ncbi:hypothetical protein [Mesorhizobium australicum]|uniref:hypothetical protein n=1 Tax=Mesorhizobium australicum TaxID=536018 RepID=UPI00111C49F5|nr:hypothetical protein [Mesorhizobium australicum]
MYGKHQKNAGELQLKHRIAPARLHELKKEHACRSAAGTFQGHAPIILHNAFHDALEALEDHAAGAVAAARVPLTAFFRRR